MISWTTSPLHASIRDIYLPPLAIRGEISSRSILAYFSLNQCSRLSTLEVKLESSLMKSEFGMQGISWGNQKMKTAMLKRAGHSRMSVQLIRQRMHARSQEWKEDQLRRVAVRQQIDLWRKEKSIITPYPK